MRNIALYAVVGIALLLVGSFLLWSSVPKNPKEVNIAGFKPVDSDGDDSIDKVVVSVGENNVVIDIESGIIETKDGTFVDTDGDGSIDTFQGSDEEENKGYGFPRVVIQPDTDVNMAGLPVVVDVEGEENGEVNIVIYFPGSTPGIVIDFDGDGLFDALQKGKKIFFDNDEDGNADSLMIKDNDFLLFADLDLERFQMDVDKDGTVEVEGNNEFVCIDADHDGLCDMKLWLDGSSISGYEADPAAIGKILGPEGISKLGSEEELRKYVSEKFKDYIDAFEGFQEESGENVSLPRYKSVSFAEFETMEIPHIDLEGMEINACKQTVEWYVSWLKDSRRDTDELMTRVYPYDDYWAKIKIKNSLRDYARDYKLVEENEVRYVYTLTGVSPLEPYARDVTRVYIYAEIPGHWKRYELVEEEHAYMWVDFDGTRGVVMYCDDRGRITYGKFLWWDLER